MTDTNSHDAASLARRDFVLATDLDGTFLGGSMEDRRALYDLIEANRDRIGLIFVTGRDPAFIAGLCGSGAAPWPEYVIGDVGTTIARVARDGDGGGLSPIRALEAEIAGRWDDKGDAVRAALAGHPGLTVQQGEFRYRLSYDMDPAAYCPSAEEIVTRLGLDYLISDNRFFDVLPKGVSKGPSLVRLIEHLGVPKDRVLAAGDTLNDLSMLLSRLKAVAVGNSEPELIAHVSGVETVYRARRAGAGGIAEAIAAYDLFPVPSGVLHAV